MQREKKVLITGAAGNLGSLLGDYLKDEDVLLHLMTHKKAVKPGLVQSDNVRVFKADLADKKTLNKCLKGVDVVVHFAGVLFKGNPEKFLPITNTKYFKNLLEVAVQEKVKRIILISFPHVEGVTNPDNPARGKLSGQPESVHAQTRLEEEKLLFQHDKSKGVEAVSLRLGMVYGKGILMIEAARWFARHRLLGVWREATFIHLISTADYLEATKQAVLKENISGIYHVGDEGVQTLQEFLNDVTEHWGYRKPLRMNVRFLLFAARMFECFSSLFHTQSPLTADFIKIGMTSYYGDTSRMRKELLSELKYKTYKDGMETL